MIVVSGMYVGSEVATSERNGKTESRTIVLVADGMQCIKVWLNGVHDMSAYKLGDVIDVKVKPYSKQPIGYYQGEIIE